ncbi:armadillo interacting protein, putative [Babesia ovata]|uniref:Armadillo interacting protein, putative n=1 Tax=Babesia ovata TaxID=189622 RepID=A0A2H6KB03_9APIC|nr:armadillo interacting protein, putative [Babesia ovata]GBE60174.1 armadillo interacting protein, putative [Babesia ovata]
MGGKATDAGDASGAAVTHNSAEGEAQCDGSTGKFDAKWQAKCEEEIRRRGLQLRGESLPNIADIKMTYREAWRTGKQGCLGVRRNLWDPHLFSGTWYFVCDGTDPNNFLVLHAHNAELKWKRVIISMWELIDGFWVGNKCRVLYQPRNDDGSVSSSSAKTMVIEGFAREFYMAMIKCIHESQVRLQLMQIELKSLQDQFSRSKASPCKAAAPRCKRTSVTYSDARLAAAGLNSSALAYNETAKLNHSHDGEGEQRA